MFADETDLFHSRKDVINLFIKANKELTNIYLSEFEEN